MSNSSGAVGANLGTERAAMAKRLLPRLASPTAALLSGGLLLALMAAVVALSVLSHDRGTSARTFIIVALPFGAVGFVVGRRQPQNAIGWILLGVSLSFLLIAVGRTYSALDYHAHGGSLPLGWLAVTLTFLWTPMFWLMGLPILLFPEGRLPSPRWRWSLWLFWIAGGVDSLIALAGGVSIGIGTHVHIDNAGMPTNNVNGFIGALGSVTWPLAVIALGLAVTWIVRLIASYRNSKGERRQQLKWLMAGGTWTIIAVALGATLPNGPSSGIVMVVGSLVIVVGFVSLPVALGVAVLKYRLYDIDRLISRTLSYAIITALLVGVYVGLVTLATRVLPFSSPLGVAASTLASVALFNPVRRRVQRVVDRRFTRARYDADATIATFANRLREDVDLDAVSSELVRAVQSSVQPA